MEHVENQPAPTPEEVAAFVDQFFAQIEDGTAPAEANPPANKAGRPWTWDSLNNRADMPCAARIQAVLVPDDETGFALHARQDGTLHPITHNRARVRFRTIEQALTTLVNVAGLHPEIVIDAANWRASTGPV